MNSCSLYVYGSSSGRTVSRYMLGIVMIPLLLLSTLSHATADSKIILLSGADSAQVERLANDYVIELAPELFSEQQSVRQREFHRLLTETVLVVADLSQFDETTDPHFLELLTAALERQIPLLLQETNQATMARIVGVGFENAAVIVSNRETPYHFTIQQFEQSDLDDFASFTETLTAVLEANRARTPLLANTPAVNPQTGDRQLQSESLPSSTIRRFSVNAPPDKRTHSLSYTHNGATRTQTFTYDVGYDIELVASNNPPNKFLRIAPFGQFNSGSRKFDNHEARGYFLEKVNVTWTPNATAAAEANLALRRFSPETANSIGSYSHTTGWSLGFEAGVGGSKQGGPSGGVSVGLGVTQENTTTMSIPDFAATALSTGVIPDWSFELKQLYEEACGNSGTFTPVQYLNWESMHQHCPPFWWGLRTPPPLANNTFAINTEAIWSADLDYEGKISFGLASRQAMRLVASHDEDIKVVRVANPITVDFSTVTFYQAEEVVEPPPGEEQETGALESPRNDSFESGIGLIRGWICDAEEVEIQIDSRPRQPVAYGTNRSDTRDICEDTDNGFGLTVNWNNYGDGDHTLKLFVDGVEFTRVNFTVTSLGESFLRDASGQYTLSDFPQPGQDVTVRWSEPHQNFVIASAVPQLASFESGSPAVFAQLDTLTQLESPQENSFESGIGLIRGWVCNADEVQVQIDNRVPQRVAYGTNRGDTRDICGDTDNGFGFTVNWNNYGDGSHVLRAYADGEEFARVNFTVTTLGANFLQEISAQYTLEDFLASGDEVTVRWSEPHQNFVIIDYR